jgi:hypothetical protein
MSKPRVEELEPRCLLNGAGWSGGLPLARPSPGFTARIAEGSPFVHLAGEYAGPSRCDGPGMIRPGFAPSHGFLPHRLDSAGLREFGLRTSALPGLDTARIEPSITINIRITTVPVRAGPDAAAPVADGMAAVAVLLEPLDSGGEASVLPASAAVATLTEQANRSAPSLLENLLGAAATRALVLTLAASPSPVVAHRETRELGEVHELLPRGVLPESEGTAAPPPVPARPGAHALVLPAPHVPGVLAALSPLDPAALENAVRMFLERLERQPPLPAEAPRGGGPWPWLVAGAAAFIACEIARRQLRCAALSAEPGNHWSAPVSDPSLLD